MVSKRTVGHILQPDVEENWTIILLSQNIMNGSQGQIPASKRKKSKLTFLEMVSFLGHTIE